MLKKLLSCLIVSGGLGFLAAQEITLDASKWHSANDLKSCQLKTVELDGAPVLEMTFLNTGEKGYPEARLSFPKLLDTTGFTHLNFQIRFSKSTTDGSIALRGSDWAQWMPGLTSLRKQGRLPADEWLSFSIPLDTLPEKIKRNAIIQIGFGFPVGSLAQSDSIVFLLKDLKLVNEKSATGGDAALTAQWNTYIKNYKPDYRDGSYLRQPPEQGRLSVPLALAKNGAPAAEIIAETSSDVCLATAAGELQHWIKEISGAELPVLAVPSEAANTKIFLGAKWAGAYPKDLEKLAGSDGFAVRSQGHNLYIFGANAKGAMNGIYTFLEANSDIIWPRPRPDVGAVFTVNPDLAVVWGDACERPVSRLRGWGTNYGRNHDDEIWMARNRCNYPNGGGGFDPGYNGPRKAWGGFSEYGGGHNLLQYVPVEKYFDSHPEFFCFQNGQWQRSQGMEHQICFTNAEMTAEFIKNALAALDKAPADIDCLNVKIEDNWGSCECPNCLKPITLPDGKVLTTADPAFRSTQFFLFLNQVAEAIYQKYPKLTIGTYAYFFTAVPPAIKPYPTIRAYFCPYIRNNDKFPLFAPVNSIWWNRIQGWAEVCGKVVLREYYGVGMEFPRPLSEVAAGDLKVLMPMGVLEFTAEIQPDWNRKWFDGKVHDNSRAWDVSMLEYWVITRLYWNPEQDVEQLRKYFLNRTFRAAAAPMEKFYGTIREAWFKDTLPSTCGDTAAGCTKYYIIDKGLEEPLRGYLAEAEELADHPVSKQLVQNIRQRYDGWINQVKETKIPQIAVPLNESAKTFDSPAWQSAATIPSLQIMANPKAPAKYRTEVKLLHDARNLYIYMICHDPDTGKLYTVERKPGSPEAFTDGDHGEVFLGDQSKPDTYYQFCFDARGNKCDLNNHERMAWNANWDSAVRVMPGAWEAIVTIPLNEINFNLGRGKDLKALFMREFFHGNAANREYSTWGGGSVHQISQMGTLTLMR